MTSYELMLVHVAQGVTYSWDLTVLIGLGIPVSLAFRQRLLQSRTTADDAACVRALYARKLLGRWRG